MTTIIFKQKKCKLFILLLKLPDILIKPLVDTYNRYVTCQLPALIILDTGK